VACVRRGDTAAFEALYDRHVGELLRFCVYMLTSRQDAEDAVQATFASAYRALRADSRPVTLRPWLFTIARNECLSMLRRRRPLVELDGEAAPGADPLEQIELRDEVRRVFEGLRELPESQRAALLLAELHGLSHNEVGTVMGVRADQVKAFVYQARSKLVSERAARDADCREIREELATARGPALLRGRLRRHVRSCPDCRSYADGMARHRRQLGALMPIVPPLALKYKALEEALGIGASDPVTVAGGATVGATAAGTAAELASGGINAVVCKVAVGVACLGASAGVGVSVLGSHEGAGGGAGTASATASTAPLVASVATSRPLAWTSTTPAFERASSGAETGGGTGGDGGAVQSPGLPTVQNGVDVHEVGSASAGGDSTPSTAPNDRSQTGTGSSPPPGRGSARRTAAEERRAQREATHRANEEQHAAREEHQREAHSPASEEERHLKHEERAKENHEKGESAGPPTEEEIREKKERRERRKAERQKRREEQEALEAEAGGG
jgi:RNA polymerase sigma factor (sigma-70 family)